MRAILFIALTACSIPDKQFVAEAGAGDDGSIDAAPAGTYRWIRSMSSMPTLGIASGAGGMVVVGDPSVPLDLGGGVLTPVGGVDMVVAGFNESDASHIYSVRHGAGGQEFGFLDVTDNMGAPIVYGLTGMSPYDLGQGSTTSGGQADGYIGRYGATAPAWVQRMVGPLDEKFISSARGTGSAVYGMGWFEGNATWNGGSISAVAGRDIIVARFNTFTGACDQTKTFGTINREEASGGAFSNGGGVILAGFFAGDIDPAQRLNFGGTTTPLTSTGGLDVYVTKLDANGAGVWAKNYGGTGDDRDPHITTDAAGDIYVAAGFNGSITLGGKTLMANGGQDVFVAKLSGTDGSVLWAKSYGGTGDDGERGITVDAKGHVIVSGSALGSLDGAPTLGGVDAVLISYDAADGNERWRKVYSTPGDDRGGTLVIGASGDVLAIVGLGGAYDFGVPITGSANPASVIVRIVP